VLKKKITKSDYLLIAANLLPVIGVLFWDWSPIQIFMVYALETVVIGIFTILKLAISTIARGKDDWYNQGKTAQVSGFFFILFFIMHYGIFVMIQTGIFIGVSGIGKGYNLNFFDFFIHWPRYIGPDGYYMLAGFIISYGFNLIWNFIRPGYYKTIPMMLIMFQPYGRIFIQQLVVILGSIFLAFGAGTIFIMIFAAVKIFIEIFIDYDNLLNRAADDLKRDQDNSSSHS
jgi:hypothetical protein